MRNLTLLILLAVAGCSSPESLQEVSTDIVSVEDSGPNLIIKARQELVSDRLAMAQLGALIGDVAEGLQEGLPGSSPENQRVQLQLAYATVDRLGNEGSIDAGTIVLPIAELRAANTENLGGSMWLGLVESVSVSGGSDPMIQHCADPANFVEDQRFCGALAASLE